MIGRRFEVACERLGFNYNEREDHDRAFPPAAAGDRAARPVLNRFANPRQCRWLAGFARRLRCGSRGRAVVIIAA